MSPFFVSRVPVTRQEHRMKGTYIRGGLSMFSPYERDNWYCPPVQWYWNGSHWNCVSYPVDRWKDLDWNDAAEKAEQTYRDVVLKDYGPNPLVINIDDAT